MHDYMHAILIDPAKRMVARIKIPLDPEHQHKRIKEALGLDEHALVTSFRFDRHHRLWLDDEGLLVQPNPQGYFRFFGHEFAGRGLILGMDQFGSITGTHIGVTDVHMGVEWVAFDELTEEARNPTITVTTFDKDEGEQSRVIPLAVRHPDDPR